MTIEQAENKIKEAKGDIKIFWKWMQGQTMGLNEDGTPDIYEYDVDRFIKYKCNPKNEPIWEID